MSEYDHLLDSEEPDGGSEPLPPLRAEPLELPPPEPFSDDEETPPEPGDRTLRELLPLNPYVPLTPGEEETIRAYYGYTASERRTRAERQMVADRIASKMETMYPLFQGELPPDIAEVWCVSESSERTARTLIGGWGLIRFRNSELHTQAVKERESNDRMAPIRAAYVKAVKEKEKKK